MSLHGGPLNGGGGVGGGFTPSPGTPIINGATGGRILERVHSVSYHATNHKLILDVETDQTVGSVKSGNVGNITIQNTGGTPAFAILAYKLWTGADTTDADTVYHLNYLLKPGESIYVPDSPAVIADETVEQLAGTVVTDVVPSSSLFVIFPGTSLTDGSLDDNETVITVDDGDFYRVGDKLRIDTEVTEITSISANDLTVIRGVDGSIAASHIDNVQTKGAFYNGYHDFDRYSVVQTDDNGRYKSSFFPVTTLGRAGTHLMGFTPGSIAVKFYSQGYQNLGLSAITSSTNSGLTAGDEYKFNITVDGGSLYNNLAFTIDSSNTNFGGTNGVISKIQSALDTQYYTAGNLFEKRVTIGIVGGDIRFTSGSHLAASKILLEDPASGTTPFGVGRIPDIGISAGNPRVKDAVPARLPNDTVFDPITYSSSPNTGAFMYDDGNGRLFGMGTGTINYETGAIDFTGLPNAEFVVSCLHTSAFSGRQNATDSVKMNSLKAIYGNTPNQKWSGELTVTRR